MDLIKILNLLRIEQLPEEFNEFSKKYLDNNGEFTKSGRKEFLNKITGYISYLNREKDIRYFSYPVFHEISTFISKKNNLELEKLIEKQKILDFKLKEMPSNKENKNVIINLKKEIKENNKEINKLNKIKPEDVISQQEAIDLCLNKK
jgi:hypothetical protein